ncbi:hypothetical protein acsn021_33090 [Anaerocolumna cellulosilytica]|uniref:Uncharacterized protein n=1 Tax=Anaerocolumna cellulosilytica TaxID=433286 RepID=A0A6S6R8C9_9FIRM|nr:GNAT family N-acetyltransferase [Anaerocolumna cellulosilytica]MBB5196867.1 HAD superfamily hydrolase (TIGR01509 family) [Anaerocolumna cellulosilytica]BCJ95740.1 hypothetical protein acsn021_33090 [Anaerocolumna cellulosilytica]
MLKAVIFDMDGVIIDSEPLHAQAAVNALKNIGVDITIPYCYGFIGSTTAFMLETIIRDYNLPLTCEELLELYKKAKHTLILEEGYTPVPYVQELIEKLYHHGYKLAIASSSSEKEIADVVSVLGIKKYFHKLVSGTTVSNPKPAPDVFIKALKELGLGNKDCIVIEDSYNGVTAANAAGIPAIGFVNPNSGNQNLSGAAVLIEGFDEITPDFIHNVYQRAHGEPVTIAVTNRLIIRELAVSDIPVIYTIYQNPEVKKYVTDIDDYLDIEIEKHKAYIRNVYNFYGYGLWGVFQKDTKNLIGRCGIQDTKINGRDEIELGYLLDYNHWGFGYAVECIKAIIDYSFTTLGFGRLVAVIHPKNTKSVNVALRVGMHQENTILKNGLSYDIYVIEN